MYREPGKRTNRLGEERAGSMIAASLRMSGADSVAIRYLCPPMTGIAPILLDWYDRCGRDLPWRRTRDPYLIWLSEVILQQTRVAQGRAYYERFAARFPDVASLAAASEDEVLLLWQGLGYYSRALNLRAAACEVVERFGGRFPRSAAELRTLRGVGEYTAAAVASAAFGEPEAAVDGNVYRVLARLFDLDEPIDTAAGRRLFAELAREGLDPLRPGDCNQALMDFGALVCTPASPRCDDCPLAGRCLSRAAGSVAERPVKRGRTAVRERWFHYLHLRCGDDTFLCRRDGRDIWQGLYEFPMIETGGPADFAAVAATERFREWFAGRRWRFDGSVVLPPHRLSHRLLHATVHRLGTGTSFPSPEGWLRVPVDRIGDRAVPRLLERYLEAEQT